MHFFGTLGTCPLSVFGRSMRVCVCVSVAPSTEFAYDVRCTHVLQTPRVCHAPVAGCCVCPMHVTLHGHFGIGNEQQANDDAKWKHVQQNKTFFIKSVRSENCHMPLLRGTCECVCGDVIVVAVLFFFLHHMLLSSLLLLLAFVLFMAWMMMCVGHRAQRMRFLLLLLLFWLHLFVCEYVSVTLCFGQKT